MRRAAVVGSAKRRADDTLLVVDEKEVEVIFDSRMCRPPATALTNLVASCIAGTLWSSAPAATAHAVHTRKARGDGGVGFVQKTTIELSIFESKSLKARRSSRRWTSMIPMMEEMAASTASTTAGSTWAIVLCVSWAGDAREAGSVGVACVVDED